MYVASPGSSHPLPPNKTNKKQKGKRSRGRQKRAGGAQARGGKTSRATRTVTKGGVSWESKSIDGATGLIKVREAGKDRRALAGLGSGRRGGGGDGGHDGKVRSGRGGGGRGRMGKKQEGGREPQGGWAVRGGREKAPKRDRVSIQKKPVQYRAGEGTPEQKTIMGYAALRSEERFIGAALSECEEILCTP